MVCKQSALAGIILIGWFFTISTPKGNGVFVRSLIGPYVTKDLCQADLDMQKAAFEYYGITESKFTPCVERQDA